MGEMHAEGESCPVSGRKIGSAAARFNGLLVTALLAAAVFLPYPQARWLVVVLAADLAIKVLAGFRHSPMCRLACVITDALRVPTVMVDLAPKCFAATIGLVLASLASLSWFALGSAVAFYAFAGVHLFCAALEGVLGFCLGCWMYGLLPPGLRRLVVCR